ncbi:hypothetical protein Q3G72_018246 [Acer saccharum]|nr:hypothetical protein Q3G72_018246 [Acer saccharum]
MHGLLLRSKRSNIIKDGNNGKGRMRKVVSGCLSKLILGSVVGVLSKIDKDNGSGPRSLKMKPNIGSSCNAKLSLKENQAISAEKVIKIESRSGSKEIVILEGHLSDF